jgi:large subunit ribosomal protein L22
MIYTAKHRFADVSAQKMRPFANMIRGKNVDEALEALRFLPNRGARLIEVVLKSAIGNAEDQGCRNLDELVVTDCRIDGGPMYKRIRPRARGTAFMILRRLSHISVGLTDMEALEAAQAAEAAVPQTAPPPAAPTTGPGLTNPGAPAQPTAPTAVSPEPPQPQG